MATQGLVGAEHQLLTGLTAGIKRPRYLGTTERTVVEVATVFTGKGHTLGHTLVDDIDAQLSQAVDIGFTGAEVATLDGVIKQAVDAIAVIAIIFGGIDAPLGGNAMGTAGAVLITKRFDVVTHFGHGCGSSATSQPRPDHNHRIFTAVRRVNKLHFKLMLRPFLFDWSSGNIGIDPRIGIFYRLAYINLRFNFCRHSDTPHLPAMTYLMIPNNTTTGIAANPTNNPIPDSTANPRNNLSLRRLLSPSVCVALHTP